VLLFVIRTDNIQQGDCGICLVSKTAEDVKFYLKINMRNFGPPVRFCYKTKVLWAVTLRGRVNSYRLDEDLRLSRSLLGVFDPKHGGTVLLQMFTQRHSVSS
jgi:hypothetical protein